MDNNELMKKINMLSFDSDKVFFSAIYTDKYELDKWTNIISMDEIEKLLEIRIFDENKEFKAFRGDIGTSFFCRELVDDDKYDIFEEFLLLDIDVTRSDINSLPGKAYTANGGAYNIPVKCNNNEIGIVVKNYILKYDTDNATTIHAHVVDWRIAMIGTREGE